MLRHSTDTPDQAYAARSPLGSARTIEILIVDDTPENLVAAEAALAPLGQELHTVRSGEDGLRFLLDHPVDLILLDVRMPGLDGFETAALIRERAAYRRTPILFLTADSSPENVARGYSVGAADYIQKPIDAGDLRSRIQPFVDVLRGKGLDADTPCVMVVSSDEGELLAIECALSGLSARVVAVPSAAEALPLASREPCAVILLGSLASGDPFETALRLRHDPHLHDVPMIFLSHRGRDLSSRFRGYAMRTAEYLVAPVEPGLLRAKVSLYVELLRRHLYIERQDLRLRELEQARAVAAIVQSERRFEGLLRAMNEFVYTLDTAQRITGLFGHLLGRDVGEDHALLGRTPQAVWGEQSALLHEQAQERALRGEQVVYEWSLSTEGVERNYQTSLAPMRDAHGNVSALLAVARDVTEQRLLQLQLMQADRMASMGMLAAGVAHEINNPLTAVIGYLQLLQSRLARPANEVSSAQLEACRCDLQRAADGAERIAGVVADLRMFTRKPDDRLGAVDVRAVLESTLAMAANELRQRVRVIKEFGETPAVFGSAARLGQVFLNLLINAAQAVPEGQAGVQWVRVRTRSVEDRVIVEIQDSGPGMSKAVLAKLFSPLFTTKPAGVGTGLGLTISKKLVEDCGGQISIESVEGVGTTARVVLKTHDEQPPRPSPPAQATTRTGRPGHILVLDDESSVADLLAEVLGHEHTVSTLTDARAAIDVLRHGTRFDLILCDLMMPGLSGMEFFRQLERIAPEQCAHTVFMTGGAFTEGAKAFLAEVDNPCLEKPIRANELKVLVAALLGK